MRRLWVLGLLALVWTAGCDDSSGGGEPALGDCGLAVEKCLAQDAGAEADQALADMGATDLGATVDAEPMDALVDAEPMDAAAPDAEPPATLTATEGHEHEVEGNWLVAGQPSEARLTELVELGAVIISLRTPGEDPFDEQGLVEGLGGTFIRYATTPADYDQVAFREGMYDLYDEWRDPPVPVYLHCASANRAGTSWALYLAERQGVPGEEAIARGRAAGMGAALEARVRSILGLD